MKATAQSENINSHLTGKLNAKKLLKLWKKQKALKEKLFFFRREQQGI
jgi:ABC-type transporter Mla MlaB component